MQGPAFLSVKRSGGYRFEWRHDPYQALRFFNHEQADATMMAIRDLRPDLFPACVTHAPHAAEYDFNEVNLPKRKTLQYNPNEVDQ
jgi:hypothetical protein